MRGRRRRETTEPSRRRALGVAARSPEVLARAIARQATRLVEDRSRFIAMGATRDAADDVLGVLIASWLGGGALPRDVPTAASGCAASMCKL